MSRESSDKEKRRLNDVAGDDSPCAPESRNTPRIPSVKNEPIALSLEKIRTGMVEKRNNVLEALLKSSTSFNNSFLEAAICADPAWAAARYPPPVRSHSKSFDAVCCALEQIRCRRLHTEDAAEWLAEKSARLIDKKIAKSVLTLSNPDYCRNRGKYGPNAFGRKDFAFEGLEPHPAWGKYRKLVEERFCSEAFAALLLACEYELEDSSARQTYMPDGIKDFLLGLGFYPKEVDGYSSLIRDEGAKAARMGWDY